MHAIQFFFFFYLTINQILAFWDIFFTLCIMKACVNLYFFTSTCLTIFLGQRKIWNYIRKWIPPIWTWVDRAFAVLSFLKVNLGCRFINMIVDAIACLCVQLWSLYSVSGKFLHLPWMWFSLFFAVMYFVVVLVFCGWEVKWGVFLFCFVLCLPSISHFCVMK